LRNIQYLNIFKLLFNTNYDKNKIWYRRLESYYCSRITVENVARVTEATALWLNKNFENPSVVLGHDCRFAGELFAQTAAKIFIANNVKVF